jgi:hypothetical protein
MGKYGALAMLGLAGFAALYPAPMAWAYVAACAIFEFWLMRRMNAVARRPVPVDEAPYRFTAEEAGLVARYRFYFMFPVVARESASVLAALGLSALVLAPWLLFLQHFIPAMLLAMNLLAVGAFTKRLSPLMVLRVAASKGDRHALHLLELHDPLWEKIRAANQAAP